MESKFKHPDTRIKNGQFQMDPKTYKHSVKIVKRDGRLGKHSIYLQ